MRLRGQGRSGRSRGFGHGRAPLRTSAESSARETNDCSTATADSEPSTATPRVLLEDRSCGCRIRLRFSGPPKHGLTPPVLQDALNCPHARQCTADALNPCPASSARLGAPAIIRTSRACNRPRNELPDASSSATSRTHHPHGHPGHLRQCRRFLPVALATTAATFPRGRWHRQSRKRLLGSESARKSPRRAMDNDAPGDDDATPERRRDAGEAK